MVKKNIKKYLSQKNVYIAIKQLIYTFCFSLALWFVLQSWEVLLKFTSYNTDYFFKKFRNLANFFPIWPKFYGDVFFSSYTDSFFKKKSVYNSFITQKFNKEGEEGDGINLRSKQFQQTLQIVMKLSIYLLIHF